MGGQPSELGLDAASMKSKEHLLCQTRKSSGIEPERDLARSSTMAAMSLPGTGSGRAWAITTGTNSTRDRWGNKIAEGNIVTGLIMDERKRG